jgi:hypothetical protein
MNIQGINILDIQPEERDIERVIINMVDEEGKPLEKKAEKQAKLIKDPEKLVRRAKAVVSKWGVIQYTDGNMWSPFKKRMKEMGFTDRQIQDVYNQCAYKLDFNDVKLGKLYMNHYEFGNKYLFYDKNRDKLFGVSFGRFSFNFIDVLEDVFKKNQTYYVLDEYETNENETIKYIKMLFN